jgi:hypothetical protein
MELLVSSDRKKCCAKTFVEFAKGIFDLLLILSKKEWQHQTKFMLSCDVAIQKEYIHEFKQKIIWRLKFKELKVKKKCNYPPERL